MNPLRLTDPLEEAARQGEMSSEWMGWVTVTLLVIAAAILAWQHRPKRKDPGDVPQLPWD